MKFLNVRLSLLVLFVCVIGFFMLNHVQKNDRSGIHIGIVMPMEHPAMHQIIDGFKEQFVAAYKKPVFFDVQCAQGDDTLMRAIIQSFITKGVALVAPIGKKATQMSMGMVCSQPVIGLAVDLSEKERISCPSCSVTGVCDEISRALQVDLLKQVFPEIKKIALVYSASEKVFPEVAEFVLYAARLHIQVQKCMVQAISELYTISKNIDRDVQALFILKDHLVVSGINTLVKEAQARHIPLIASDNSSVEKGAMLALGIEEAEIGRAGARLAVKVIQKSVQAKTHQTEIIDTLTVFVNKQVNQEQHMFYDAIKKYAKNHGYVLQQIEE